MNYRHRLSNQFVRCINLHTEIHAGTPSQGDGTYEKQRESDQGGQIDFFGKRGWTFAPVIPDGMHIPVRTLGTFGKSRSFRYGDVAVALPAIKFFISFAEAELKCIGKTVFDMLNYFEEGFSFIVQNVFRDVHHRPFRLIYQVNTFPSSSIK